MSLTVQDPLTNTTSTPVSALILTLNEEKVISRCLQSLLWADEIIVVDALSEDQTADLVKKTDAPWAAKVRWIQRAWTGFKDQRNFALTQAKHSWILFVDADEACSPELAHRIQNFFINGQTPPLPAYKIRRIEYFLGKQIRHGIWNPSYQDRFFYRIGVQYTNNIHEYPVFPSPPQPIHEPLYHWPDFEPEKFLYKMNRYTTIEAVDRVKNGQRTNVFRMLLAFPAMFLKNYFYYGAYKDGIEGFAISILEGISRAVRHIKIWQFSRKGALSRAK